MNVVQLKVIQEVVALSVFAPFAVFMMNQPLKLDYLWSALCLVGAVYFAFRWAGFLFCGLNENGFVLLQFPAEFA